MFSRAAATDAMLFTGGHADYIRLGQGINDGTAARDSEEMH